MSYQILPRSRWTTTSPGGSPINWGRVRGIVCHYPGSPGRFGVLSASQEQANFRGWRNYHTQNLGWRDIGYCYGITQAGRIYTLRGDRVGGHTFGHNSTTIGVMFMVGNDEPLTDAARGAFRALRATLRGRGCGSAVWGHREMPRNSTACPGPHIMADIRNGKLTGRATAAPVKTPAAKPRFADVDETQRRLKALGYDPGPVDGKYGPRTAAATKAAQQDFGITPVDGKPGPATRKELKGIMAKIDDIARDIRTIKRSIEPGVKGKRTDGELVSALRRFRNDLPDMILDAPVALEGKWKGQKSTLRRMRAWYAEDLRQIKAGIATSRSAVLEAVQETGRAQGLTDEQVQAIATAAAEASARVSAEDVAGQLEVSVRDED